LFVCFCELVCCCSGLVLVLSEWGFFFLLEGFCCVKGRWEVGGFVAKRKKYIYISEGSGIPSLIGEV
jgi:hypothetical protein